MLCQFRLLQSQWRWLLSNQNFVDQRDRPALFAWVKKLVYAPTEIESRVQYVKYILCSLHYVINKIIKNYTCSQLKNLQ